MVLEAMFSLRHWSDFRNFGKQKIFSDVKNIFGTEMSYKEKKGEYNQLLWI